MFLIPISISIRISINTFHHVMKFYIPIFIASKEVTTAVEKFHWKKPEVAHCVKVEIFSTIKVKSALTLLI